MNRLAKIRQSFRTPDGWRFLPVASGTRGMGQVPIPGIPGGVTLPELPGYVTRDACDKFIADTVVQEKKSRNSLAAGVAIGGILLGFMFGRATKNL